MAMAIELQEHQLSDPVGLVRWLPSPFHRLAALSLPSLAALQIHSLSTSPSSSSSFPLLSSHSLPSPASALSAFPSSSPHSSLLAAATSSGSLHFFSLDTSHGTFDSQLFSLADRDAFHAGPIQAIDVETAASSAIQCATAGEDGRLNLVSLAQDRAHTFRVRQGHDIDGLVAYTAVKWASPVEFVSAAVGPGLQCWDKRSSSQGPVAHFRGGQGFAAGMIHSIDIHPSRKHTCVVGGSSGTVYAWDLRWPQQPITLAATGTQVKSQALSASEVWEVKYDAFTPQVSSTKVLPVMICSEDGFLAVLQQDESPVQLLEEPCAINSFDIDPQNPSDVIVALEWESVAILSRGREDIEMT